MTGGVYGPGHGRSQIVLRTSLAWRSEINREARARGVPVTKMLLEIIARELGLGQMAGGRRKESVTARLQREWLVPGTDAYAEAKRRRRAGADGAAGAGDATEDGRPGIRSGEGGRGGATSPSSGPSAGEARP